MASKYFRAFGFLSGKVFLNVALFVLYLYFFGVPSLRRYFEKSIVIITKDLDITSAGLDLKLGEPFWILLTRLSRMFVLRNVHPSHEYGIQQRVEEPQPLSDGEQDQVGAEGSPGKGLLPLR